MKDTEIIKILKERIEECEKLKKDIKGDWSRGTYDGEIFGLHFVIDLLNKNKKLS